MKNKIHKGGKQFKLLSKFRTTIDDLEQKTGLDFLNDLPKDVQDKIESKKEEMWNDITNIRVQ